MTTEADAMIDLYERHAAAWVNGRLLETGLYERDWLDRFCALLPPAASILDIGCGAGQPIARHLTERGFAVTGVDSSPAMVAMFQTNLPGQPAYVADMRSLSLGRRFHGILAWDSFFHLNHDDQRRMFPIFHAHAAPGTALLFTSGPAHGEIIGELEGEPLYHSSLAPAEYRKLLNDNCFEVVKTVAEDPTCYGRTVWLAQSF